jgi:hypothetical protein
MARVKDLRGVRKKSQPLTAQQIRSRYLADLLDSCNMLTQVVCELEKSKVETISPIPGGIETTLRKLRRCIRQQFRDRFDAAVEERAWRDHRLDGRPRKS